MKRRLSYQIEQDGAGAVLHLLKASEVGDIPDVPLCSLLILSSTSTSKSALKILQSELQ